MKKLCTLLCLCTFFFFANAQCPITNGGFENGLSGWNVTGDVQITTDAKRGSSAVEICNAGANISQVFPAQPGSIYDVSIWGKRQPGQVLTMYKFRALDANWQPLEINRGTNYLFGNFEDNDGPTGTYLYNGGTITTPADAAWFQVIIFSQDAGCISIDDVDVCLLTIPPPNECANDTAPPVFTICPSDQTATTTGTTAFVNWGPASASDNCGSPTLSGNNDQGIGNYPVGVTEINLIATDDAGNSATCSFNITVTRDTPPSNSGNLVLETSDVSINQWSTGIVEFTLRNVGGATIDDVRVSFNLEDNIRLQGGNEFEAYPNTTVTNAWSNLPIWNAGTLAAGGVKFIKFNVFAITDNPMYIFGQVLSANGADPNSSPGNGTSPTPNEDDEAVANINGTGGGTPDLQMGSMVIPRPAAQGQTITNDFNFRNVGDASVNQPFAITAYLSTDGNISNNDFVIGNINFTDIPIAAGETNIRNMNMTIPSNAPAGLYYLIVKVDANDVISESNENNNINSILGSFEVIEASAAKPDLRLFNLTLDELSIKSGDVLNYNFDIGNLGTANVPQNFNIRAYLSTDGDISNDDTQDGIVPTGNFDAGLLVSDVPGASTINLPEGDYYLILRADADNQVNESDETNNDLQSSIQFTVDNNPGGNGSPCDKQIAQDITRFNCIETNTANGTINVVYNTANGVIEKTIDQNLDVIGTNTLSTQGKATFLLDGVTLTKTNADGSVAYTRTVPQAFADRFNYRPQIIEFMGGFVFFGQVDDPAVQKGIRTDNNFNVLFEKDTPIANDPLRNAIRSINTVNGNNIAFISGSTVTYGSSATLYLWDASLNELDNLPLFSGAWQGGSSLKENACNKWTVTDGVGLGYCKSGGCYRSVNREVEFANNSIQVNSFFKLEHRTQLGVGYESYSWSAKTGDGGLVTAGRYQNLTRGTPVRVDEQIDFTKTDANGNIQWERNYLITDWTKVFRIYESGGVVYILKNVDGELLISDLECYDLPTDLPDLVITDVVMPNTFTPEQQFTVDYKISNIGTDASSNSTVALYLSRDDQLGGFDTRIPDSPTYGPIGAGDIIDGGTQSASAYSQPGNYYLLIVADADGEVIESNENNNVTAIPFEVTDIIAGGVDLELSVNPRNSSPDQWSVFTTTVTVTNTGGATATGVEVEYRPTPAGAVYQGGNEGTVSQGTFKYWKNIWEVGSLAAGESATLDVNLFRILGANFVMYTQVAAQNEVDIDSAPNNGICCGPGEDDEVAISIGNAANGINNRSAIVENLGNQPFAIVNAMPNPFTEEFNLQVFSNENQESEITVMNAMGQAIFKKEVNLTEGLNTIPMNIDSDASGILMVKMTPFHPYLRQIRVMRVRD